MRKGDIGRPTNAKLRYRPSQEEADIIADGFFAVAEGKGSRTLIPDGNSARSIKKRGATSSGVMEDDWELFDTPEKTTISKDPRKQKSNDRLKKAIRRRTNTEAYEDVYLQELDPNNRYNRNRQFAEIYGYEDENRLNGGRLKTDNAAGKASVKRQFQDAKERRGHGDTKYRDKKKASDPVGYGLKKGGAVKEVRGRVGEALERTTKGKSKRVHPRAFATTQDTPNRTVPTGKTVLDRDGKNLNQQKPRKGGRVRERLNRR